MTAQVNPLNQEQAWELVLASLTAVRAGKAPPEPGNPGERPESAEQRMADQLLNVFLPLEAPLAPDRPSSVIAQLGQSLDGRIATVTGKSRYINGEDGLLHLHRLRAVSDAVIVGSGTAAADNPRLTVRLAHGPNPVRVLIDRHRKVPDSHHLFCDGSAPTLRLVATKYGSGPLPATLSGGVQEVACLTDSDGPINPEEVLAVLSHFRLRRLFVEGGGQTVSTFLQKGLLDRLHVIVAPMIIGSGQPAFTLREIDSLKDALRPETRMVNLGSDMLFDLNFRGH